MATQALTIVRAAFIELGVLPPDQVLGPDAAQWGLEKLNRIIDRWRTRKLYVWCYNKIEMTIGVTQEFYTIGKSGLADFYYDRPVSLDGHGDLILTSTSPNVVVQLNLVTIQKYEMIGTPSLQSTQPTTLYYVPTVPDGTFYLWPVPTNVGNIIRLFNRQSVPGFYLNGVASLYAEADLPPGYEDALIWNLAEELIPTYPSVGAPAKIEQKARMALYSISGPNSEMPNQQTKDSGMPDGGRQNAAWFNYLNGEVK